MAKSEIIKVTQPKTHSEKLNPAQIMSIKTRGLSLIVYDCIFLDQLSISNNSAEQAMRIPALGRKNWLFSQSIKGAIANGYFLTVIQTAIANGLDPRKYLEFLIDKLANLLILNHESIEAYLPWACLPQEQCKPLLSEV